MSYSFSAQAATKAELKSKVAEQLAAVVVAQPAHEKDQAPAQAAADAFIDLLLDDDTCDAAISMSGSLTWNDAGTLGVNVSLNTFLQARK